MMKIFDIAQNAVVRINSENRWSKIRVGHIHEMGICFDIRIIPMAANIPLMTEDGK